VDFSADVRARHLECHIIGGRDVVPDQGPTQPELQHEGDDNGGATQSQEFLMLAERRRTYGQAPVQS
jgi:hypothetical protein